MAVVGIGTDIVDIRRIENMAPAVLERFIKRVLTPSEIEKYQQTNQPLAYLAKRWAAKEAAAKALGLGIADGISFQDFTITNLPSGKPQLTLSGRALAVAEELTATDWQLSLSDEKHYAVAFVVLSR